jgi:hypothetical protein
VRIVTGILGIDPGLSGALALWRNGQWTLLDVPVVGDAKRHEINGPELCRWLREHEPDHAFLEYAAARPGQGVTSERLEALLAGPLVVRGTRWRISRATATAFPVRRNGEAHV